MRGFTARKVFEGKLMMDNNIPLTMRPSSEAAPPVCNDLMKIPPISGPPYNTIIDK